MDAATTTLGVAVRFGRHRIHVTLERARAHPTSLIGAALGAAWREGSAELDLSAVVAPPSPALLATVEAFYSTGELRVPDGVRRYDALCCWNDLNLVPRLPALLSAADAEAVPLLAASLATEVLTYHEAALQELCAGACAGLTVCIPRWSVPAAEAVVLALRRAVQGAQVREGGGEGQGPANAPTPPSALLLPFPSMAKGREVLSAILDKGLPHPGLVGYDAARDNVLLSLPESLSAAVAAAETWLKRAKQATLLAHNRWAIHAFERAMAGQGLEVSIGLGLAGRDESGRYEYGGVVEQEGGPAGGKSVPALAWFDWTSPAGEGWKVPSGAVVTVQLVPHWSC